MRSIRACAPSAASAACPYDTPDRPSCRQTGRSRWTARDFDGHRLATDVRRRIALPAPVSSGQMLRIVRPWCHVNEVPAIRHVGDDEVAASGRRRLRELLSTEPNRVFKRLVVRLGGVRRGINGTRCHARGDVDRCDRHQIHRRTNNRMAGIRGCAANNQRARYAHHLSGERSAATGRWSGLVGGCGSNHQHGQCHC